MARRGQLYCRIGFVASIAPLTNIAMRDRQKTFVSKGHIGDVEFSHTSRPATLSPNSSPAYLPELARSWLDSLPAHPKSGCPDIPSFPLPRFGSCACRHRGCGALGHCRRCVEQARQGPNCALGMVPEIGAFFHSNNTGIFPW